MTTCRYVTAEDRITNRQIASSLVCGSRLSAPVRMCRSTRQAGRGRTVLDDRERHAVAHTLAHNTTSRGDWLPSARSAPSPSFQPEAEKLVKPIGQPGEPGPNGASLQSRAGRGEDQRGSSSVKRGRNTQETGRLGSVDEPTGRGGRHVGHAGDVADGDFLAGGGPPSACLDHEQARHLDRSVVLRDDFVTGCAPDPQVRWTALLT